MTEVNFSNASARRIANHIVDMREEKRRAVLKPLSSDLKCKIVEEMVNIRLSRLRDSSGTINPMKVSER